MRRLTISILSIATLLFSGTTYAFNIVGEWSGSPDCPLHFYQDDGKTIEGDCDNGAYNHIIKGTYSSSDRIDITIKRIDPDKCITTVRGYIKVINDNKVKIQQQGWDGCGVRTKPGSQIWNRVEE